jgi:hypothetical protein
LNRAERRKAKAEIDTIINKAKKDMEKWMSIIDEEPTLKEIRAWQSGYVYGINRSEDD